jgi:malonyl CoA-acyl carrier protein transacylase
MARVAREKRHQPLLAEPAMQSLPVPRSGGSALAGCDQDRGAVMVELVSPDTNTTAVLFPGQGSHVPGMREDVARRAPALLERCVALVGEDPFPRVQESTRFAQPAIFCAALAGWEGVEVAPVAAAGHSLGEFAALAAAGVLDADDALALVVLRGRLMAEADGTGTMLALLGGEPADAEALAAEAGVTVANDNAPGQVVLSGDPERLQAARRAARARGLRAMPLGVAGAFHSPSMAPAVAPFRAALDHVALGEARFPVFSCATAAPFQDVRAELASALVRPVRWRETVLALHAQAGVTRFVETGPGEVLAKLVRRILPEATVEAPGAEVAHA